MALYTIILFKVINLCALFSEDRLFPQQKAYGSFRVIYAHHQMLIGHVIVQSQSAAMYIIDMNDL